eukprot:Em0017g702a
MAEEENMDTSGDPVSAGTTTVVERVVRMSLRPPPRFGAKGDWKLWLSRFEMYATQAKIAKDSWSKELLSLLEDEPYRMVTHHGLAQTGDYDAVCDCIQRSYAPLGSELEWQLKVRTRVQKVGESLMEFCGALRGMADKAFPAWPAEQLQDLLRNQFIQGVLSSSVQLALMKEEPKTLDDALKLACKHEMVETAQKHLQMLRQKEVVASTEGESSNSELLTATLRRDRERSEVETLRREVQRLSEKLKGGQRGRVDNSEEREKTGPVCWNCKSRGHVCTMQSDVWLPCWTLDELAEEQRQDSSIGQVIQWMENDSIPRVFPKHLSSHTQALKPPPAKLRAPLQLDPAVRPLQRVAMDIMGPLPETSRGNKYILVIADYFTKWSEAYPIPNMEAITVAKCLVNEFICRFGVPEQLHSDQGRNFEISTEQVLQEGVEYVDYLKKRFQLVHQYVRQNAQKGMQRQKTGYDQKENTRKVPQISSTMARTASPPGEQEPSEEEEEEKEEKGTPSEEQESRGEEINKEPQESMADLQDEQYIYVETRRPEPGPAVEEHVPTPPLIAPAPRQPPQPPAEPELPQPGEQLRRSTRNRHPPHWYGHIVVHSAHTHTNCEDTVSLDGELCNDGNSCTHEQHY